MKPDRIFLAITVLVLASLACRALMGGGIEDADDNPPTTESITLPDEMQPTAPPPPGVTPAFSSMATRAARRL